MPTEEVQQEAYDNAIARTTSTLDGDHSKADTWRGTFTYAMVGAKDSHTYEYATETIFKNVGVPQGRTVVEAYLHTYITDQEFEDCEVDDARFYCEAADNPSVPSDLTDFTDRYGTGNYSIHAMYGNVDSTPDADSSAEWDWDITNAVQDVIDRGGFSSGNNIGVFIVSDYSASESADGWKTWDSSHDSALIIKYKPTNPANFSATATDPNTIDLSWDAQDTQGVRIQRSTTDYPTSINDGTTVVNDTVLLDEAYTDSGLTENTTYYYSIWGVESIDGTTYYSDGYNIASDTTPEAIDYPTTTTYYPTVIYDDSATGQGGITDTGGENCDERGFVYDDTSYSQPGDTEPNFVDYTQAATETGSFGTGDFTDSLSSINPNTTYYYRAYAHNSAGYAYASDEESFLTKPTDPTSFSATALDFQTIELSWSGGSYDSVLIRYSTTSYPSSTTDGSELIDGGVGGTQDHQYLESDTTYYYSIWGKNSSHYSDNYLTASATTPKKVLKYYDGNSWVSITSAKIHNGSSWVEKPILIYQDGSWSQIN